MMLVFGAMGCAEQGDVAAEMQGAIADANDAVTLSLLMTELAMRTGDDPSQRHGRPGLCPWLEKTKHDGGGWELLIDFDEGCLPADAVFPLPLDGQASVTYVSGDIDVDFDTLRVSQIAPVTGKLSGTFDIRTDGTTALTLVGDPTITQESRSEELTRGLDISVSWDGLDWTVDGTSDDADLRKLSVPVDNLGAGGCPNPASGHAILANGKGPELDVDYGKPGDGKVTVTRKNQVSEPVDPCRWLPWFY